MCEATRYPKSYIGVERNKQHVATNAPHRFNALHAVIELNRTLIGTGATTFVENAHE
jgi:hypothetical protein